MEPAYIILAVVSGIVVILIIQIQLLYMKVRVLKNVVTGLVKAHRLQLHYDTVNARRVQHQYDTVNAHELNSMSYKALYESTVDQTNVLLEVSEIIKKI